jgi:hypothetical protein
MQGAEVMKSKEQIEQEVMKTLQCFEQRIPLESNPFFSTRVLARVRNLEEEKKARSLRKVFSLGSLRPALLTLIIVLNVVSAIIILRGNQNQTTVRDQYFTAFADEYAFNQNEYDFSLLNKE